MPKTTNYEPWFYRFSGALATKFIGREGDMEKVRAALEQPGPGLHVILFTGHGGLGKTRSVEKTLALAGDIPDLLVAREMVDFYHFRYHSTLELMLKILDMLKGDGAIPAAFAEIRQQVETLSRKRVTSDFQAFRQQLDELIAAFNEKMAVITRGRRVVLAFDTLERLVYQDQEISGETMRAESWDWLVSNAAKWGSVTLVLAGRARATRLFERIDASKPALTLTIPVHQFNYEDRHAYFRAAREAASDPKIGSTRPAEILQDLIDQGLVEKYARFGGRPIIFSLLLHLLCLGPVETGSTSLEETVVNQLVNTPGLGDFVMALGRLPKGANAPLLARVLDVSEPEAQRQMEMYRDLSFIKHRPEDGRIFLHDEMYTLLYRYVYSLPDDVVTSAAAHAQIDAYYGTVIQELRQKFTAPFRVIDDDPEKDTLSNEEQQVVVASLFDRQTAMAERLQYRLRSDTNRGLRAYYRYMREALRSPDPYFSLQLQAELLHYQEELDSRKDESIERQPFGDLAHGMVLIFPVVRHIFDKEYSQADEEAQWLARYHPRLFSRGDRNGLHASLTAWRADAMLHNNAPADKVTGLLGQAIAELMEQRQKWEEQNGPLDEQDLKADARLWFQTASLAMAHYILAYTYWSQGRLEDARQNYVHAQDFWRAVRVHIELATTNNDLAYATSEFGIGADPTYLVEDALEMRWQFGPVTHISLSRNTAGIIAMRQSNYGDAQEFSRSALRLAHAVEGEDGREAGLAHIALSEAARRMVTYSSSLSSGDRREARLKEALKHAERGRAIFEDSQETVNLAAALIEVGCANRDLLRLYKELKRPEAECQDCEQRSRGALLAAAEKARAAHNRYREADALVNLGWLGFVAGSPDGYDDHFHVILDELKEYTFHDGKPPCEGLEPLLWTLLGKHSVLHGMMHMAAFDQAYAQSKAAPDDAADWRPALRQAARKFTESFEYSARFSKEYPGIRQANRQLLNRLKLLNRAARSEFVDAVHAFENEYGLEHNSSYLYQQMANNFLLPG